MKKYSLLFLAIIVLSVGFYITPRFSSPKTATPTDPVATTPTSTGLSIPTIPIPAATEKVAPAPTIVNTAHVPNITILIASTSYPIYAPAGMNVVDAMQILASSTGLRYTGHTYSGLGMFIDSIDGKENSNGYYWFLYMNGKSSPIGASQTKLKDGDVIEWRYEKSY